MTSQHKPTEILKIFKEELPECFKKGNEKIPLMQGIHHEVIAHYKNDLRFDNAAIRHAIRFYVSSTVYLRKVVEGTPRINFKGKPIGTVSASEEHNAKIQLAKRTHEKKYRAF